LLDHLEIRTRRLDDCVAFYQQVLEPTGYRLVVDGPKKGFGSNGGRLDFWIVEGEPSIDVHYAFLAADRAAVDRAYGGPASMAACRSAPRPCCRRSIRTTMPASPTIRTVG
jgi:catechol 2,3-dioxygenase-like lactoylglutathione lyase family enzyme